jgi:hypothetical protein
VFLPWYRVGTNEMGHNRNVLGRVRVPEPLRKFSADGALIWPSDSVSEHSSGFACGLANS